jgi:cytosolic carboxypeptidase protein 2/3
LAAKEMMRKTQDSRDILFYCDYHGHSRAKNLFMYGCANSKADRLKEKIFPWLFGKSYENFKFESCNFAVQKAREGTARVVMWKEFNLINSFTLETTFCGATEGRYKDCHFSIQTLKDCGRQFCKTLLDYASSEAKVKEARRELEILFPGPPPPSSK